MSENVKLKNKVAALQRKNETMKEDLEKRNRKMMDDYKKLYETEKKWNQFETMKKENDTLRKQNRRLNQKLKHQDSEFETMKIENDISKRHLIKLSQKLERQDSDYGSSGTFEFAESPPQIPKVIKAPTTVSKTQHSLLSQTHRLTNEVHNASQPRKKPVQAHYKSKTE